MTNGGSMSGVRLTEHQAKVLHILQMQTDTNGRYLPYGSKIVVCRKLASKGLAEAVQDGNFFTITPAGRAWLAANAKDER